jgi:hypothetical protein
VTRPITGGPLAPSGSRGHPGAGPRATGGGAAAGV